MNKNLFNDSSSAGIEHAIRTVTFEDKCPYLGMKGDSATSHGYPHNQNMCFRNGEPDVISLKVQTHFCLSGAHENCAIFQQEYPQAAEENAKAPPSWTKKALPPLALAIPVLLLLIAALIWWPAPWTSVEDNTSQAAPLHKVTSQEEEAPVAELTPAAETAPAARDAAAEGDSQDKSAVQSLTPTPVPTVVDPQDQDTGGFRVHIYD